MKKLSFFIILLLFTSKLFAQISNFKALVGYSESRIKQSVTGYNSVKEIYAESGKSIYYSFRDFTAIYQLKGNGKCSKAYIVLGSESGTSQMNQWFYENGYTSRQSVQTGEYEWSKTIKIKSEKGNVIDEFVLTAIKVNAKTYFFADKLATLLGY